jgi:soluble lytic murein transglycosylase-like protein
VAVDVWMQNVLETRYNVKYPKSALLTSVILEATEKEDADPILTMAQIYVESSYRATDVSSEGAFGLMQVMAQTATLCPEYRHLDKYENVFAGLCILNKYRQETGTTYEALAAYNVGITNWRNKRFVMSGSEYRRKILQEYWELHKLLDVRVDTQ